jgi:hypothetical protein
MTMITAKRLGLSFVVCLLLGSVSAAPIFAATVSACPLTGSYQTLLTLGSCSILDKIFTNFQFTPNSGGTALLPNASSVTYSLDVNTTSENLIGFEFNPGLSIVGDSVNPNKFEDILLQMDVCVNSAGTTALCTGTFGPPEITSLHLLETGFISGSGSAATVTENYCLGHTGLVSCTTPGVLNATIGAPHQDAFFAGVSVLSWRKDINVNVSLNGGIATISGVRNGVDETSSVPEPATLSFLGGGLVLLGMLRRRRA